MLKKNVNIVLTASLVGLLLAAGCGDRQKYGKYTEEQMQQIQFANKYDLPPASGDSMVLGVFSETITSDEILGVTRRFLEPAAEKMPKTNFTQTARPYVREAVKGKVTDILLYQEARKTVADKIDEMLDQAVDTEISKFVASYGNNYALAEEKIKAMGMDWRTFREYQKKLILTRSYLSSQLKSEKRYSQQQLKAFYDEHKEELFCSDAQVAFSVIEIHPDELDSGQVQDGESLQAAAHRIGQELIERLEGDADFSELAKVYHGGLAAGGGKVLPVIPGTQALPEPYNTLELQAVQQMQPGEIEGPITIDGNVFIVRLDLYDVGGCKKIHEVQDQIVQHLDFQHQQKLYEDLVDKLVQKTDLVGLDEFTEFCVRQAYDRWGQSS